MATRKEYKYDLLIKDPKKGVYDGDTFRGLIKIDLGFKKYYQEEMAFRLFGLDTPEVKSQRKIKDIKLRAKHKLAGIYIREFVKSLLLDKWVVINTRKEQDKYGRVLTNVEVSYMGNPNVDLSELLISSKCAKPYFGGTKSIWEEEELDYIIEAFKQKEDR